MINAFSSAVTCLHNVTQSKIGPCCYLHNVASHNIVEFIAKTEEFVDICRYNKTNSTNLYPPTKGYLRETLKSQNINPIYLTLNSPSVSFRP